MLISRRARFRLVGFLLLECVITWAILQLNPAHRGGGNTIFVVPGMFLGHLLLRFFGSGIGAPGSDWVHVSINLVLYGVFGLYLGGRAELALSQVRLSRRRSQGLCTQCGYDLRERASERCPECGVAMVASDLDRE